MTFTIAALWIEELLREFMTKYRYFTCPFYNGRFSFITIIILVL